MRRNNEKGLSGGKRYGPPPKKGPNPQGLIIAQAKKFLRKASKKKYLREGSLYLIMQNNWIS